MFFIQYKIFLNNTVLCLVAISIISIILKLYFIDFSLPIYNDNMDLTLRAFTHLHGNFEVSENRNFGWPLFLAPFLSLINSDNWIDYSVLARIVSLSVSTLTIIPMFLLSRKFFENKYAIIAAGLFSFEPHLNQVAGLAQTEPIFLLAILGSFYFILSRKNDKFVIFSFILAAISYWIRPMGLIMIVVISIIYFIHFKKSFKKYLIYLPIFILVLSPVLIIRSEQYGDPFYYGDVSRGFVSESAMLHAENVPSVSLTDLIKNNELSFFIKHFVIDGLINIIKGLTAVSLPYLIVLWPIGIIGFLWFENSAKRQLIYTLILIILSLSSLIIVFSTVLSIRFLFPIIPYLILFAIVPIKKISEYLHIKSPKKSNIFLALILITVLSSSILFGIYKIEKPDQFLENEKITFSNYIRTNFNGEIFNDGWSTHYFNYVEMSQNDIFKTYFVESKESIEAKNGFTDLKIIRLDGDSLEQIISDGEKLGLTHLAIEPQQYFHPFLNDVYVNENNYPYLNKIFDSEKENYQKLRVKVFTIDNTLFHKMMAK